MIERSITLADTVTVDSSGLLPGGDQAALVGTGAIWKDDSDATYADLVTQMNGPGQPQFGSGAAASVVDTEPIPRASTILVRLRASAVSADMPYPAVALNRDVNNHLNGQLAGTCPTSPTWVDYAMSSDGPAGILFLDTPSTFALSVNSPFKSTGTGSQHWRIYEAKVIAVLPSSDAPPCRIFPRSDGLGIGAGRAFPPPKSQQRSPGRRGVGYY